MSATSSTGKRFDNYREIKVNKSVEKSDLLVLRSLTETNAQRLFLILISPPLPIPVYSV